MMRRIATVALLGCLSLPAAADDDRDVPTEQGTDLSASVDALPAEMKKFNGMLVGRLLKKDVEKGTFVVKVDAVSRVWRNSKAADPSRILDKAIRIDGVFGRWLDVLLLVDKGETLEFEARHDGGDQLTFPGELLRKVAPYRPEDYPVLPESFRGFQGAAIAKVIKKDPETFELIVEVDRVLDTWKDNRAKQPKSIEGRQMMLAGFWQRQDTYHGLKAGDQIEVGLKHIGLRSNHLSVAEFIRQAPAEGTSKGGLPAGVHGFSGMLTGRLKTKDVERGTFSVQVDAVPRVWRNNKADRPKSIVGRIVEVDGVTGKWLDVLLVLKSGETVEFEAHHAGGDRLTFPGEWMRKAAPVKPGDYPELPESFRGFHGVVIGTVVKKNHELAELSLRVAEVKQTTAKNRASDPAAIVGKPLIVLGFWRHREAFDALEIGDRVESALEHLQLRSDHVNVGEFRKLAAGPPRVESD